MAEFGQRFGQQKAQCYMAQGVCLLPSSKIFKYIGYFRVVAGLHLIYDVEIGGHRSLQVTVAEPMADGE
nr:hypothetical protein [Lacticaseibacillus saniviri]